MKFAANLLRLKLYELVRGQEATKFYKSLSHHWNIIIRDIYTEISNAYRGMVTGKLNQVITFNICGESFNTPIAVGIPDLTMKLMMMIEVYFTAIINWNWM